MLITLIPIKIPKSPPKLPKTIIINNIVKSYKKMFILSTSYQ